MKFRRLGVPQGLDCGSWRQPPRGLNWLRKVLSKVGYGVHTQVHLVTADNMSATVRRLVEFRVATQVLNRE
jgi:hypothetical protein